MNEHLWRIPTLLGVKACSALLLFTAGVVGSVLARQSRSNSRKVAITAVLGLLALVTVVWLRGTAAMIARTYDISVAYIDPGPIGYVAPVMFAGFTFVVAKWVLR